MRGSAGRPSGGAAPPPLLPTAAPAVQTLCLAASCASEPSVPPPVTALSSRACLAHEPLVQAFHGAREEVEVEGARPVGAVLPHKGCGAGKAKPCRISTSITKAAGLGDGTKRDAKPP